MKARLLILLGPPGAGKGTQARAISRQLGIPQISTGDILRDAAQKGTGMGLAAKAKMDKGELVPDHVVCSIVEERLDYPDCRNGAILDGFPRTVTQARFLDMMLDGSELGGPVVLNLHLAPELLVKRLAGRRVCSSCGEIYNIYQNPSAKEGICSKDGGKLFQRQDDNEESIQRRLMAYEAETVPLIDYYQKRNALHDIDGSGKPEHIAEKLLDILKGS